MDEYNIWADMFNKFSQLTPWVQAVGMLCASATFVACGYFITSIINSITGRNTPMEIKEMIVYPDEK